MSDELIGGRATDARMVHARGRSPQEWATPAARDYSRELQPDRDQLQAWFPPPSSGEKELPDLHLKFFQDLIAIQGSQQLSPGRARELRDRWGLTAPNVADPAAREAALLGFQLVLTLASFYPPLAGPAAAALLVLALVRGEDGALTLAATAIPVGRLARATQIIRALMRLGRVFRPSTIQEYRAVAKLLIQRDRNLLTVAGRLKDVSSAPEKRAVRMAIAAYKREMAASRNARAAAQAAGNAFHDGIGAAGPGEGADIIYKGGKFIMELKTHYVPIVDELVLKSGKDQVIAYVLKDIVEKGLVRQARVLHVFIDPDTGKAVKLVVDPLNGQKIVDALVRLGGRK